MTDSNSGRGSILQFPGSRTVKRGVIEPSRYDALAAELQASLTREEALRDRERDLSQRQMILAREFEHRVSNGLQLIAGLLSMQSRTASTLEAGVQLSNAARRIVTMGHVHHRLHIPEKIRSVEFKQFLIDLCNDLSGLLLQEQADHRIVVEGTKAEIPSSLASPLGLIANELITNSVKYASGDITVRIEKTAPTRHVLSVLDYGSGLPPGYEAAKSKGLGMKLVLLLVKQIGGDLQITPRANNARAGIAVSFCTASRI
jgi:two-component sensor histidine kinase